jgi:hypothetical protein
LSQNNAARDYVMQRQHHPGTEHYAAYDADANEITHAGTSYKEEESTLSGDLETELHDPNALTWERGIDQIAVPGKPVAILLAVPAIPEMLARARYQGSAPDPLHRPDVSRVHGFASTVEIGGRRLDVVMVARENRQGRLTLDRMEPYAAAGARAA